MPGLTVQATSQGVRILDDGFPVPGATVRAGGKTAKTGASGVASLGTPPHHTAVAVSAAGLRARLGRLALSEPLEGRLDEIGQRREVVAALEHRGDARRQGRCPSRELGEDAG